jgi:Putative aminopeptidase
MNASMSCSPARRLLFATLILTALAGCNVLRDVATRLPGPRLYERGAEVIGEIRAFEYRIGFRPTDNFLELDKETESYPYCGFVSRLYLPYSYSDPGIQWRSVDDEAECRLLAGEGTDIYFGQSEAVGQIGTPVTGAMMSGSLTRFVYLVIHEDCHDQFDLPQSIEEALCNVITYHAMVAYAEEKERPGLFERAAMRRYAERESERTRLARAAYEDLERLYARHARKELATPALMEERARVFARAERALALDRGSLNNVGIANDMTYSRHFPYLESVLEAQGRDLARFVAFFRRVDALKPTRAAFLKQNKLKTEESVEFIRGYEAAVLETITRELGRQSVNAVTK